MIQQNLTPFGDGDGDGLPRAQSDENAECVLTRDGYGGKRYSPAIETSMSILQDQLASIPTIKSKDSIHSSEVQLEKTIRESVSDDDDHRNDPPYSRTLWSTYSTWLERSTRSAVLFAGASLAGFVLFVNTILLVVSVVNKHKEGLNSSPVYNGNCHKANKISIMSHVLINIMSTLLLGASNFAMQVLAAPTREEVDRAHSKGKWLDIGVPSLHNVLHISKTRRIIYLLLCLSSIPLHLLYNSAIFTVTSTNVFDGVFAFEDFLNSTAPYSNNNIYQPTFYNGNGNSTLQRFADEAHLWRNLSRVECARVYQNLAVIQQYSDLLLIADQNIDPSLNIAKGYIRIVAGPPSYYGTEIWSNGLLQNGLTNLQFWSGSPPYDTKLLKSVLFTVKYCLAKPEKDHCQIHFSSAILIVVIIFNILKTICLFITAYRFGSGDRTLVVLGDAIGSFLNRPDDAVKGVCTANRAYFAGNFGQDILGPLKFKARSWFRACVQRRYDLKFDSKFQKRIFDHKFEDKDSRRWSSGVSKSRWYIAIFLIGAAVIIGSWLFLIAFQATPLSAADIWSRGLGNIYGDSTVMLFSTTGSVVMKIVFVNAPQVVLSVLFFIYNALLTTMLVNLEYVSYSTTKKALRVSTRCPDSIQRNTYYLQLPYRYGIPLLGLSCALHYTMSQSLFVVDTMSFYEGIYDSSNSGSSIFYSELGIILTLSLGITALITIFIIGFCRRYTGLMPLGGTCSASIAAACWRPQHDCDAMLKEVQWGELVESIESYGLAGHEYEEVQQEPQPFIPHLCFTSMEVNPARSRVVYL